jgi:hypothetical protein
VVLSDEAPQITRAVELAQQQSVVATMTPTTTMIALRVRGVASDFDGVDGSGVREYPERLGVTGMPNDSGP